MQGFQSARRDSPPTVRHQMRLHLPTRARRRLRRFLPATAKVTAQAQMQMRVRAAAAECLTRWGLARRRCALAMARPTSPWPP